MRVRKRYVAAALTAAVIIVGGVWLTFGVLTAPEWEVGQSWTYRADDGRTRWNVTFRVDDRVNLSVGEAWRVHVAHDEPDGSGSLVTRYFLVETLNEAFNHCDRTNHPDCRGVYPWFDFPVVGGETWEWRASGDARTHVESRAAVWQGEATVTHAYSDGQRLEFEFRQGSPFFTTRMLERADGTLENWWLTG